ncbi:MAG: cell division protein SepF [Candidatus Woesearchaeota archaeon]
MRKFFSRLSSKVKKDKPDSEEGYVEIETESEETKTKIVVRPFMMKDFEDVKEILDALRAGQTIALINIRPLKDKDLIELKRAINKLKKTCDAIEGEIAGFGEDWIVVTPSFATIYRTKQMEDIKEDYKAEHGKEDE